MLKRLEIQCVFKKLVKDIVVKGHVILTTTTKNSRNLVTANQIRNIVFSRLIVKLPPLHKRRGGSFLRKKQLNYKLFIVMNGIFWYFLQLYR